MIGKKINQLATELAPTTTDLTIIGDPISGVSKKITLEQLGAIFGGAVSFYTTLGDFPATGVIDIIYCAKDTKKLYLWSGSAYVEVFPSQSLLDTYQLRSEKGVSNGYASLDVNGKVPIGQLPNSIMEYKGTWSAATNTPTLANGTGDTGDVYLCNAAGSVNFGAGPITFAVGDYVVYSGSIYQRSSGAVGTVTSVAASITGDAIGITGSPVTTSGTLAFAFGGNSTQYINGAGNLVTFPGVINEAQNLITEVYNKTGATLTKGTVVYINGGQGNLPSVTKALATGDSTSAQTYGIVRNDITNNNNGYVVVAGRISDLDTQAYTEGTQLYLSPTTAGTYTSTKPYAPNHLVYVGIVVRAHPTQGVVEVKIQNGYEMDELHNVAAQNPDNNDILQYKTATSLWTKVAGTTSNIAEGSNLYYTDARSRAALSFTAGSGAYNSTTGVITIPTNTNQLTNGAAFITLASLSAGAGISYNNTTGVIASTITQYTDAMARAAISLTTTGTSGAATYNSTTGVLNVPQYAPDLSGYVPTSRTLTINGTSFDLSANRSYSVGTVTSVGLSSATSGVTIGSTPITSSGTITLAIATASGSQQGLLSSTDWTTFNNKQSALTNPVTGTGTTNYLPKFTGTSTIGNSIASESGNVFIVSTSGESRINVRSGASNGIALTFTESGVADRYLIGSPASSGDLVFRSGSFNFSSGTETMRLTASGNLSIGNTNNTYKLDVSGNIYGTIGDSTFILSDANGYARFTSANGNAQIGLFRGSPSDGVYIGGSNQGFQIYNSNFSSVLLRVTQGSNVLIGTTTDAGYKLDVSGTGRFTSFVQSQTNFISESVTNSITVGLSTAENAKYNYIGHGGYWGIKTALTGFSFALDTYNGGTPKNVLTITQAGAATFSSSVEARKLYVSPGGGAGSGSDGIANIQTTSSTLGETSELGLLIKNNGTSGYYSQIGFGYAESKVGAVIAGLITNGGGATSSALVFATRSTTTGSDAPTERMRITSSGNVGIGTTSPSSKLHIESSTFDDFIKLTRTGIGSMGITATNPRGIQTTDAAGNFVGWHVTATGNVGIGTTSPTRTFQVNGYISSFDGTTNTEIISSGGIGYFGTSTNHPLVLQTNNTERMRITSGGNVEIATGSIKTGEPDTGYGRAAFKIGTRQSGTATDSGGYIPISIDGTVYFINLFTSTP